MEGILARVSIMLVPALLAVTLHEVAHGYVAERFGDPTARLLGRLTLNPLRHLDPIGTLALFYFGFGWARPVPINYQNLRRPRRDMIWVALSGPATNLALAVLSVLLLKGLVLVRQVLPPGTQGAALFLDPLSLMAAFSLYINVILGVFNLLPVPPLDGGRVLAGTLPERQAQFLDQLEPFGLIVILFLIFFTPFWQIVLKPIIDFSVTSLAGHEVYLVEKAKNFLIRN